MTSADVIRARSHRVQRDRRRRPAKSALASGSGAASGQDHSGNGRILFGSRVDVPPGGIRFAWRPSLRAAGWQRLHRSGRAEIRRGLALGGLSLALAGAPTAKLAELLARVLPLVPLASSEIPAGTQVVAQLPVRVSSRAGGPLAIDAKLTRDGAAPQSLDAPAPDVKPFAAAGGSVYTVALPANLGVGNYRLVVEAALGREKASREVRFRVVGG